MALWQKLILSERIVLSISTNYEMYHSIPDVLSVSDLQKILHIGRHAAYSLVRNNEIRYLKIGRTIRIPKRCLLDYIENSCYNASAATDRLPPETEV